MPPISDCHPGIDGFHWPTVHGRPVCDAFIVAGFRPGRQRGDPSPLGE
jgi:hypothetical protein